MRCSLGAHLGKLTLGVHIRTKLWFSWSLASDSYVKTTRRKCALLSRERPDTLLLLLTKCVGLLNTVDLILALFSGFYF